MSLQQHVGETTDLQLVDFVLDPFACCEALTTPVRQGRLSGETIEQLALVLPQAIAQLDAIGDLHGALALAELYDRLSQHPIAV